MTVLGRRSAAGAAGAKRPNTSPITTMNDPGAQQFTGSVDSPSIRALAGNADDALVAPLHGQPACDGLRVCHIDQRISDPALPGCLIAPYAGLRRCIDAPKPVRSGWRWQACLAQERPR